MTERYSEYDNWAWLYNVTAGPEYSGPQLALLERVVFPSLKKGDRLLDLCCGTGQLLQPLIDQGYRLTGLDGSKAMLEHAKDNAPEASVLLADARSFHTDEKFHAVFSTSASLNHIPSIEDLRQVFQQVSKAMHEGGTFVFDINHAEQMRTHWRGQPGEGEICDDYAWMITPFFDQEQTAGRFKVDIYRRENNANSIWKKALGKLLSHTRFMRMRLRLLKRFARFQPQWHHSTLDYTVHGHDLDRVKHALIDSGFSDIQLQTIDGGTDVTVNHSAHFIMKKAPLKKPAPAKNNKANAQLLTPEGCDI